MRDREKSFSATQGVSEPPKEECPKWSPGLYLLVLGFHDAFLMTEPTQSSIWNRRARVADNVAKYLLEAQDSLFICPVLNLKPVLFSPGVPEQGQEGRWDLKAWSWNPGLRLCKLMQGVIPLWSEPLQF